MTSKILLLLIPLICFSLVTSQTIPLWGQCGNIQGSLGKCEAGSFCKRFDAWYSQCVPGSDTATEKSKTKKATTTEKTTEADTDTETETTTEATSGTIPLWGQCGNFQGTLGKCASGSYCKRFDAWYSQCVPK